MAMAMRTVRALATGLGKKESSMRKARGASRVDIGEFGDGGGTAAGGWVTGSDGVWWLMRI